MVRRHSLSLCPSSLSLILLTHHSTSYVSLGFLYSYSLSPVHTSTSLLSPWHFFSCFCFICSISIVNSDGNDSPFLSLRSLHRASVSILHYHQSVPFLPVPAEIGDMAQQEDGWPLGLQPVNLRVGLVRNRNLSGSVSFSTLLTASPTYTDSSSDLDTESTGSFFHDKSITLGSLIGLSSILDLSRRSTRGRMSETLKDKKNYKSKTWLFSLCSRLNTDAVCMKDTPSLGHFLEAERRAATGYRRNQSPTIPGPGDFSNELPVPDTNSLFIGDQVAPQSSTPLGSEDGGQSNRDLLEHDNGVSVRTQDSGTSLVKTTPISFY